MRGERADYGVVLVRDRIVDQQADADAAIGGFAQRREQELARIIPAEEEVLRVDRPLRVAFNDFARTNVTAGEIEELHRDVNAVMARNAELEVELATLRRLIEEQQSK